MAAATGFVPGRDFIGTYEPDAYESVHDAFGHGGSSTMERASSLDGFIRRGCDKAQIRITLHDKDCAQPTVITRTLERRQGTSGVVSSYVVHQRGKAAATASADEVKKLAQSFGIFVDNNCQVLPQESIANFVNSAPADLLKETERAILSGVLYDKHMKLEEVQSEAVKADAQLGKLTKERGKLHETQNNYTRQLARNEKSKKLAEELEALKLSKPWLDVHDEVASVQAMKHSKKHALKEYAAVTLVLPEAEELAATTAAQFKSVMAMQAAAKAVPREARKGIQDSLTALSESLKKVAQVKMEVENLVNTGSGRERDIQRFERDLRKGSKRLEQLLAGREPKDLKADVATAKALVQKCHEEQLAADRVSRDMRLAYKTASDEVALQVKAVARLKTADDNRINHVYRTLHGQLKRQLSDVENKRQFVQVQAEGPLAAAVKPKSDLACCVLNSMPIRSKLAYICASGSDLATLASIFKDAKLSQAQMFVPEDGSSGAAPEQIMSDAQWAEAKRMGATAQIMDEVECSGGMRVYLEAIGQNRVVLAPDLNTVQALSLLEALPSGIRVATRTVILSRKRGRLSGVVSHTVNRLGDMGLFKPSRASEQLQRALAAQAEAAEAEQRCQAKLATAEAALQAAMQTKLSARQTQTQAEGTLTTYESLTSKYELDKQSKRRLEELIHNKDAIKRELQAKTTQYRSALCDGLRRYKALCKSLRAFPDGLRDEYCITVEHAWTQGLSALAKSRRDELLEKSDSAEREAEDCTVRYDKLKKKLDKTRSKAEAETGVSPAQPDDEKWQLVRDTLRQLEETHKGRPMAEAFNLRYAHVIELLQELIGDAELPAKLEAVTKQLAELDQQIQEAYETSAGSNDEVRKQHDTWVQELRLAVKRLSEQFASNCEALGVKGTIELHEAGSVYKDYGLNLISSFHGAELSHAAAATQSGGEKSVTTILFLLAMQRSAPCPFRIIDEINQGMDETNERKVMHLIGTSSMPSKEQREALCLPAGVAGTGAARVRPRAEALADPRGTLLHKAHHIGHQYFMLTPKLLPDLHFPDHVRIHTVFNGAAVNPMAYKTVTLSELVKRRRSATDMGEPQPPMLQLATAAQQAQAQREAQRRQMLGARSAAKRRRAADDDL